MADIPFPSAGQQVTGPDGKTFARPWYDFLLRMSGLANRLNSSLSQLTADVGGIPTLGTAATKDVGTSGSKIGMLDTANAWSAHQTFSGGSLTDGATIAWDLATHQITDVTLAGNRTLANPTNMVARSTYILIVKQDATGSRTLTFGSAYLWPSGNAPSLTPDANGIDVLSFVCDGTHMFGGYAKAFA